MTEPLSVYHLLTKDDVPSPTRSPLGQTIANGVKLLWDRPKIAAEARLRDLRTAFHSAIRRIENSHIVRLYFPHAR
jgi:hypothetical protein